MRLSSVTTAQPTIGSDFVVLRQPIEGTRFQCLNWGTAAAVPCVVAFKATFPQAGTMQIRLTNPGSTLAASANITVATANVEAFYAVTLPAQTTGTWVTNLLNVGAYLDFLLASSASTVNCVGGTTFSTEIAGVVLFAGSDLPPAEVLPLLQIPYAEALTRCQRYLFIWNTDAGSSANMALGFAATSTIGAFIVWFPTPLRVAPTIVLGVSPSQFLCGGQVVTSLGGIFMQAPYSSAQMNVNVASGLTTNTPIMFGAGTASARWMADARL
jgi:hypothetical protein